ncbi:stage II sporulation protein M [Sphingomonas sp. BAUL-RG-20F-R05-02]|uniref:stage II sporulation protein M n=1 Tax=Sphingomonas sp. BAUL-RG-20F-R05-02 TaxID=2914830 RepID=UPI001F56C115|nr:stage II sporulation protein M [Sphingomonas sp. BAUL-RG-20F-R05-02]
MSAFVDAAAPLLNASRFRAAHEAEWTRLEALLKRIEKKRSVRVLSDDDLLALPLLYRATLSSLSVARETSLDRALIAYLEQLCARAYFQLYGVSDSAWRDLGRFFTQGWPGAVASLWRETLVMTFLTLVGAVAAYLLVRADTSWYFGIIPEGLAGGRDPSASAAALRATLYHSRDSGLGVFASFLFNHNAQIAIFAFALGFAFVVPTALLILYNGLMLGAMIAVFAGKGLGLNFVAWLAIHGTTEMFAIIIAGAAGMRIGTAIAFPGREERMVAVVAAGRTAAISMAGVVLMLAVAAMLEGVGRQVVTGDALRAGIGLAMLAAWLVYYYGIGRRYAQNRRG